MRLSERTVLTSLHIGSYSGNAVDQEVTEEVSESHQAEIKGAGRYSKQLVSKKFLAGVNRKISVARRTHRLLTLPWDDDARILSTTGYMHYSEQMRMCRQTVEYEADQLVSQWSAVISEASKRLGTMFDAEDYPVSDVIRRKFYVDVEIKPVPESGDFRAELSDASVKTITKDIERRTEARLEAAMNDVFQRIAGVTEHMVERLRAFKPVDGGRAENNFKDSLVWNIKELAELIPFLNITNDKRLDQLHQKLTADLLEHSPEILRDNDRLRNQTADKAEKLLQKVRGYLA